MNRIKRLFLLLIITSTIFGTFIGCQNNETEEAESEYIESNSTLTMPGSKYAAAIWSVVHTDSKLKQWIETKHSRYKVVERGLLMRSKSIMCIPTDSSVHVPQVDVITNPKGQVHVYQELSQNEIAHLYIDHAEDPTGAQTVVFGVVHNGPTVRKLRKSEAQDVLKYVFGIVVE